MHTCSFLVNWRVCNSVRFLLRASLFRNTSVKETLIYSKKKQIATAVTLITEGNGRKKKKKKESHVK